MHESKSSPMAAKSPEPGIGTLGVGLKSCQFCLLSTIPCPSLPSCHFKAVKTEKLKTENRMMSPTARGKFNDDT